MKKIILLLTVISAFSLCGFAQEQGGAFKNPYDYPLDDPRNPDCPCHKYQQQADQEFKNVQQKANYNVAQNKNAIQAINSKNLVSQSVQPLVNLEANTNIKNDIDVLSQINIDPADNINIKHELNVEQIQTQGVSAIAPNKQKNAWLAVEDNSNSEVKISSSGRGIKIVKKSKTKIIGYKIDRKIKRTFNGSGKSKHYRLDNCFAWKG